jgi:hypothetical protein
MKNQEIWQAIDEEVRRAKKKFPSWPDHPAAQAGIVCEEAGELMQACLKWKYEREKTELGQEIQIQNMEVEAVQVAASAIRFLENLKPKNQNTENATNNISGAEHSSGQAG